MTGAAGALEPCDHLREAADTRPRTEGVCEECVANGEHAWVHLRTCLACGKVGCCDSSPRRHASAHSREVQHPVVRSAEPGEDWRWCYVDELLG